MLASCMAACFDRLVRSGAGGLANSASKQISRFCSCVVQLLIVRYLGVPGNRSRKPADVGFIASALPIELGFEGLRVNPFPVTIRRIIPVCKGSRLLHGVPTVFTTPG
jgi:hypothetical protein